jgi:hypothetical protein
MNLAGFENIPNLTPRAKEKIDLIFGLVQIRTVDNPIHSKPLERSMSLTGPEVRAVITFLRLQEYPIASNGKGYYYATNPTDLRETIDHLEGRAFKISQVAGALKATMKKMLREAQQQLFETGISDK